MKNWIAGLPGSIENPPKYWKLFFQTLLIFFETPDIEENWMFCCFLKFISIYVTNWQTWDLEWINDGLVMRYIRMLTFCRGYRFEMTKKLPWRRLILMSDSEQSTCYVQITKYHLENSLKSQNSNALNSKVYEKDLFWCVICGTFNLLSQNLLVNKHKLQISKLFKINQVPTNLVQNKFQKCCQK